MHAAVTHMEVNRNEVDLGRSPGKEFQDRVLSEWNTLEKNMDGMTPFV